jgi:SulP family sulfate permease
MAFLARSDFSLNKKDLTKDLLAGVTVAIVAMPLAIGFAITSGMSAQTGITTAVIAGFIAALFGGSRYQVSGPTGAMTVVLIPVIAKYGASAMPLLGVMAGIFLIAMSLLRIGNLINRVPHYVVEGFTLGIAIVIALQQIPFAFAVPKAKGGSTLSVAWHTLQNAAHQGFNLTALLIVTITLGVKFSFDKILRLLRIKFYVPASFGALIVSTTIDKVFHLHLVSIGNLPRSLGGFTTLHLNRWQLLLWPAIMVAFLAAIESLLSARVADAMVHASHENKLRPNQELLGQGLATIVAVLFGGQPGTGAIARTSVNVRSHARSRFAAMFHSLILLLVILVAAPLFSQIPTAAIAGVLIGASVRILNPTKFKETLFTTKPELLTYLITGIATVGIDLIRGIIIGLAVHFLVTRKSISALLGK